MSKQTSRSSHNVATKRQRTYLGRVDEAPHFTQSKLEPILIGVLRDFGGSASKRAIESEIERRLKDEFTPADLNPVGEGIPSWKKKVQWIRFHLVERGVMKKDSQRGVWELSGLPQLRV